MIQGATENLLSKSIRRLNKCVEILKDKSLIPVMNNKIEGAIVHVVTLLQDIKEDLLGERTMKYKLNKGELFSSLDTMLLRTIADIDEEWENHDIGREMKERIRQAYKQIKEIMQNKRGLVGKQNEDYLQKQLKAWFNTYPFSDKDIKCHEEINRKLEQLKELKELYSIASEHMQALFRYFEDIK